MYNFDKMIDVAGTSRLKYSNFPEEAPADTIPMWVADMDFETYPGMITAMKERVEHGIYGYTVLPESYRREVAGWMKRRHGWEIDGSWISVAPGIIPALKTVVAAYTNPGDHVLVQTPVYYMFMSIINLMERQVVESPLVENDRKYTIDFEDFENKIVDNKIKLFLLCNPHNPVSRSWTHEELKKMGDICKKHGVIVVSDEIHQDFIYEGHPYTPFANIDPEFGDFTVTCTAPSKTFNCAGLKTSNIIISNEKLKKCYDHIAKQFGQTGIHPVSIAGVEAAYKDGDQWVDELISYIYENFRIMDEFFKRELPQMKLVEPECLYLAWIDVRETGMDDHEFYEKALKAGVWLEAGREFGEAGKGFIRVNLACPHAIVREALKRMKTIFQ